MSYDPHRYDDIIGLPHFVSKDRKHMSNYDRAAQFAPFDALTGYDEAIEETGRMTEEEFVPGEDETRVLNRKFQILNAHLKSEPLVRISYFVKDLYKEGGSYVKEEVTVKRIDLQHRVLYTKDKRRFDLDYIVSIDGDLFDSLDL